MSAHDANKNIGWCTKKRTFGHFWAYGSFGLPRGHLHNFVNTSKCLVGIHTWWQQKVAPMPPKRWIWGIFGQIWILGACTLSLQKGVFWVSTHGNKIFGWCQQIYFDLFEAVLPNFGSLGLPRGYVRYNAKKCVSWVSTHDGEQLSVMSHKNGFWGIFGAFFYQNWAFGAVQVQSVQHCQHKKVSFG